MSGCRAAVHRYFVLNKCLHALKAQVQIVFIDTCSLLCSDGAPAPAGDVHVDHNCAKMDANIKASSYQDQLAWIERQFTEAEAEANKCGHADTLLWRIVVAHAPLLSAGKSHGSNLRLERALYPLFHRHGVHAYFNGHDHALQHLYGATHKHVEVEDERAVESGRLMQAAGIKTHFFVSGSGGGAYLQDVKANPYLVHAHKASIEGAGAKPPCALPR